MKKTMGKKISLGGIVLSVISTLIALIIILPIIWAFFCSLQVQGKQFRSVWDWFTPPYTFANYPEMLMGTSVFQWFTNSLLVAAVAMVLSVLTSTMAAYAIAKIKFRGCNAVYGYFLCGMLVPTEATIVPLFILVNNMNMINTYMGLILPSVASAMTLIITVSFFRGIPNELLEAVRIDGGSELTIYWHIALPLSKPIIVTVALLSFIGSWNNYLWPLLCVFDENMYTLPIGIPTLLKQATPDFITPMTANMIASLPLIILFIIFERQVVEGITTQGIKG